MTVGFPLLHRIGGVYGRAEEILDSHTKSMEMLWVRLQRPGKVGANVVQNIHRNILRMFGPGPSALLELQRVITEHSLKML